MFLSKFLMFLIPLVNSQYFEDDAFSNGTGLRTGEYIDIKKYPYIVSIRFARSRKVICTGILITFSWVLSVPYCFMLTPDHYKRKQDAYGIIPPHIKSLAKQRSKSISRRSAQGGFINNTQFRIQQPELHLKNQNTRLGIYSPIRKRIPHYAPVLFNIDPETTENPLTEEELKKSVIHLEPETFRIIAGASSVSAEGQVRIGERIVIHPDFKLSKKMQRSSSHELALIKTNMPFVEQETVQKAPVLQNFLFEKNPSRSCKLVGWGRGKTMKPLPHLKTTISQISVQLFNSSKCRNIEKRYRRGIPDEDEESSFCSYDEKNNAIPVCQSDSGGPLVCNDKVVGLMSWLRTPLCYYNRTEFIHTTPIYYCKIYSDLAWVRQVLGESSSRMKIQLEDDPSSSSSLGGSGINVMVIIPLVIMFFIGL
ncbi:alpha-fibrinogenase-like isoform X2 [Halyomorpha halys]|uniref:alpha-fibrinogenase-like isoform X2 n=1 Tax=Halyomorpha halys TaxID=286706 RepID=UPI000D0C9574|nr:chymase-like isoform X2 [Halyomorpha halys]